MIEIELENHQQAVPCDGDRLCEAVRLVLQRAGYRRATVSVSVVDAPTIQRLNARHLQHDWPTDVLSFVLEQEGASLDGEIIVSGAAAVENCPRYGWAPADELLLYVIHGALHLVGFDDHRAEDRARMRQAEQATLRQMGCACHWDAAADGVGGPAKSQAAGPQPEDPAAL